MPSNTYPSSPPCGLVNPCAVGGVCGVRAAGGPASGQEGADRRRLHEVAEHRRARRSPATANGSPTSLQLTNTVAAEAKPVLHLMNLETNEEVTVPHATGGTFSSDSKWIAYQVDPGAAHARVGPRRGSGGSGSTTPDAQPARRRLRQPGPAPRDAADAAHRSGDSRQRRRRQAPLDRLRAGPVDGLRAGPRGQRRRFRRAASSCATSRPAPCNRGRTSSRSRSRRPRRTCSCGAGPPTAGGRRGGRRGGAGGGGAGGGGGGRRRRGRRAGRPARRRRHPASTSRPDATSCSAASATSRSTSTGELLAYTVDARGQGRQRPVRARPRRRPRSTPLDNDAQGLQPAHVERGRHGARGAEGRRRREDARARQRAPRLPERAGGARRRRAEPTPVDARSGEGRRRSRRAGSSAIARALAWSDDNKRVFFGIKEQVPAPDTARAPQHRRGRRRRRLEHARRAHPVGADDPRRRRIATSRSARRSTSPRPSSSSSPTRRCASSTSRRTAAGRSAATRAATSHDYKRPAADIYRVNTTTGERTLMLKGQLIGSHVVRHLAATASTSSTGRTTSSRPTTSTPARRARSATAAPVSFVDMEFDHPGPKPSYGIAGYTSDGKAVDRRSTATTCGCCRSTARRRRT